MQRTSVVATVLLLWVIMLGCGRGPAAQKTKVLTNRQLELKVLAKLDSDRDVKAAGIVTDVDADQHQVTLSGAVKSAAFRNRVIDLVKTAEAGITVVDQIQVRPEELARTEFTRQDARSERDKARDRGDRIGASVDDAWVHLEIVSRLTSGEWPEGRSIHVDVLNGAVTLHGPAANDFTREQIGLMATGIKGVKKVVNNIKITRS